MEDRTDTVGLIRVFVLVAAAVVLVASVFIFSSNDTDDTDGASADDAVSDELEADGEPTRFTGSIISDNSWFAITVAADGSASGTLNILSDTEEGTEKLQGTFTGSIGEDDVVTCTGAFTGFATGPDGDEQPLSGTVELTAEPEGDDYSTWEIFADTDPGDPMIVIARAR